MRESFDEYKSIIESNVMSLSYLYSGDVISSTEYSYSSILNHSKTSPIFIVETIDKIYKDSINNMKKRSVTIEKSLDFNTIDVSGDWLNEIVFNLGIKGFDPKYAFIGDIKKLGIVKNNNRRPFKDYFYSIKDFLGQKFLFNKLELFISPLIEPESDAIIIYIVDKPIQSLVYTIQNMSYIIKENNHTIEYDFYECDYLCYKLIIKDISKMRDDRIDFILNS